MEQDNGGDPQSTVLLWTKREGRWLSQGQTEAFVLLWGCGSCSSRNKASASSKNPNQGRNRRQVLQEPKQKWSVWIEIMYRTNQFPLQDDTLLSVLLLIFTSVMCRIKISFCLVCGTWLWTKPFSFTKLGQQRHNSKLGLTAFSQQSVSKCGYGLTHMRSMTPRNSEPDLDPRTDPSVSEVRVLAVQAPAVHNKIWHITVGTCFWKSTGD